MRITVFGATGGTGTAVCREAVRRGHEVTAVVRDAARLPGELRDKVDVVVADVMDPAAVESAVAGRDAVMSCLGTRTGRAPTTVHTDGATSIITGMRAAGTRRLLVVSAAAPYPDPGDDLLGRYVAKPLVSRILANPMKDVVRADGVVAGATGIDWTIVRPPRLMDGPPRGAYRLGLDRTPPRARTIRRADLAGAMLDLADDPKSVGHVAWVAN
ncbi:NAD-dependent epimerase/dehydratase family protein [Actinomadura logoneensis]|uniref:NAD-dependent epimerase/dehydratase family protein n=1 Tax=Actinomadura logoneensis TaxID=2293572 RepID=A0A372JJX8_9ACTN|nr:NAD(P)H-binding protein [Actinomadura logoneensis]RFU40154.1 NAD-dependent epimerase/dehydratase family protein [Actinomadura logoneensis]